MPHQLDSEYSPTGEPIRPQAALQRVARILDGRAPNLEDVEAIAKILRQAGHPIRSPEEIKIRCPNCDRPDITICYAAVVGVRIDCDEIRSVTLYGFSEEEPVRVFCPGCCAEYDESDLREARLREMGGELDHGAAQEGEAVEALRRTARAIVETLDSAADLVPDRYRAEIRLDGSKS
jgi:hypothetical protein